jgi:hypothetical protein
MPFKIIKTLDSALVDTVECGHSRLRPVTAGNSKYYLPGLNLECFTDKSLNVLMLYINLTIFDEIPAKICGKQRICHDPLDQSPAYKSILIWFKTG